MSEGTFVVFAHIVNASFSSRVMEREREREREREGEPEASFYIIELFLHEASLSCGLLVISSTRSVSWIISQPTCFIVQREPNARMAVAAEKFPYCSLVNFGSVYFPARPPTFVRPRPSSLCLLFLPLLPCPCSSLARPLFSFPATV